MEEDEIGIGLFSPQKSLNGSPAVSRNKSVKPVRRIEYQSRGGKDFPKKIPKNNHVLFEAHKDYYKAHYLNRCNNLDLTADLANRTRRNAMYSSPSSKNNQKTKSSWFQLKSTYDSEQSNVSRNLGKFVDKFYQK